MRNSNLTKWVPGNPQFGVQHRGRTYWFAGPQEKQQFWANPDYYAPAMSGLDPVMAVDHRQQIPGRREHSIDYDNVFYMFASEASLQQFTTNPRRYIAGVREAMSLQQGQSVR
jgi:YHS domain-containing protein